MLQSFQAEWGIREACEFMLFLVIIFKLFKLFAKKKTELEGDSSNRDIHVCKSSKVWHYKGCGHLKHASDTLVCKMCKDCYKKHKDD
jgi:hypothetical protein